MQPIGNKDGRGYLLIVGGLLGTALALISLPLPAYEHLFGGLYAASVTAMSLRSLGLLAVFAALLLLAQGRACDPLESGRQEEAMARVRVKFSYTADKVGKPIIDTMSKQFDLVSSIRRADVRDHSGWVVLQLDGEQDDIDAGIDWVREQGVDVDPVEGDVVQ